MHRPALRGRAVALVLSFLVLGGCFERPLAALTPCTRARVGESIELTNLDSVDLLFVVDDSGSMMEEQSELIVEIPRLVQVLATGDLGLDGTQDFRPARSIHVGIVSTDMGVGAATGVTSCAAGTGDDGVLRTGRSTCVTRQAGPVLAFTAGDDAATFASDVGCAANLGTMGCAEEQPLDAMLKAIAPSTPQVWTIPGYEPPTFLAGNGHGGDLDANAGLVRDDTVLAVIVISDENDSSTLNPNLFSLDDPRYTSGELSLRGFYFPNELTPIQRYVDGLLSLRVNPSHLVFGAIVGVPVDAVAGQSYQAMLDRPEMIEQPDPVRSDRLLPACRGPFQTDGAYPGRRAIELARDLHAAGAGTSIGSICDTSFVSSLDAIIALIGEAFRGSCLPRPLALDADGRVPCRVTETLLPAGTAPDERTRCDALGSPGAYTLEATAPATVNGAPATREVCGIHQLSRAELAAGMPGWFYDDGPTAISDCGDTGTGQRVSVQGLTLVSGAQLRFECDEHIQGGGDSVIEPGTFCNPADTTDLCAAGLAPDDHTPLFCDPFTRSCAVRCSNDSHCTAAGLPGHQCDDRSAAEVFGATMPTGIDPFATHDVCVNPICQ